MVDLPHSFEPVKGNALLSAADAASCLQELNASSMVNVVWALAKTDYACASKLALKGYCRNRGLMDNIAKSAMSKMY